MIFLLALSTFESILSALFVFGIIVGIFLFVRQMQKKKKDDYRHEQEGTAPEDDEKYFQGLSVKGVPIIPEHTYVTPNGINIGSTVAIPTLLHSFVFKALEYGAQNEINATSAKFPEWTKARKLSDYLVLFIEPHTVNEDGSPALLVQGKYQTAGTVIGIGDYDTYPRPAIVLPHQGASNWKYLLYLLYSMWNEGEHFAEYANLPKHEAEAMTGTADVHQHHNLPEGMAPLLIEEASGMRGFVKKATVVPCFFPAGKKL